MNYCNENCSSDFVNHPGTECNINFKLGGISRIILVPCSAPEELVGAVDCIEKGGVFPSLSDWQALADEGYVRITGEIVGSLAEPETSSTIVSSCRPEQVHTRTYNMSFLDYNSTQDGQEHDFYRHLCINYRQYNFFFITCDEEIICAPNTSFNGNIVIPETNSELRHYSGSISFRTNCLPRPYRLEGIVDLLIDRNSYDPPFVDPENQYETIDIGCPIEAQLTTCEVFWRMASSQGITELVPNPQDRLIVYPFDGQFETYSGISSNDLSSEIQTDSGVQTETYLLDNFSYRNIPGNPIGVQGQLNQIFGFYESFDYEYYFSEIYFRNTTAQTIGSTQVFSGSTTYIYVCIPRDASYPSIMSFFNFFNNDCSIIMYELDSNEQVSDFLPANLDQAGALFPSNLVFEQTISNLNSGGFEARLSFTLDSCFECDSSGEPIRTN